MEHKFSDGLLYSLLFSVSETSRAGNKRQDWSLMEVTHFIDKGNDGSLEGVRKKKNELKLFCFSTGLNEDGQGVSLAGNHQGQFVPSGKH